MVIVLRWDSGAGWPFGRRDFGGSAVLGVWDRGSGKMSEGEVVVGERVDV